MERPAGLREAHLCAAWERGLVDPTRLATPSGLLLQIVYPGRRCGDPGPDFRDAVLALPDATLLRGDVEVHLDADGWRLHGHGENQAYDQVILHLTWDAAPPVRTSAGRPVLAIGLAGCLQVSSDALLQLPTRTLPAGPTCPAALPGAAPDRIAAFLLEQGEERLRARAAHWAGNAVFVGDDQALWQALLRGLGYHRNVAPFEQLARSVPWSVAVRVLQDGRETANLEALLLGVAGFLTPVERQTAATARRFTPSAAAVSVAPPVPEQRRVSATISHVAPPAAPGEPPPPAIPDDEPRRAALAGRWQALRGLAQERPLARADWTFAGVRPDNAPPRRIAAAVALADRYRDSLLAGLATLVAADAPYAFDLREDDFWRARADFGRPIGPKPVSVLGAAREGELLVNAVLPAVLAVAERDGDLALAAAALERYRALGGSGGNAITRHMLKTVGVPSRTIKSAALEQGLLHLYHSWCRERRCWECALPLAFPPATIAPPLAAAEGDNG